ncbi:MAG: TonB-dependent receptor [Acidobacteriaceae bacterium]
MKTRVLSLLIVFSFAVPFAPMLRGQLVSGSITGEVTDPTGAAVVGADIQATNVDTGVQLSAKTNSAGYFDVSNLIAGTYTLTIGAQGFKTLSRVGVVVDIGAVVRLDSKLEVGNVEQKVAVTGETPQLQTDKVELGITINSTQLVDLPSEGRNPTALATIQAGIVASPNNTGVPSAEGSANYGFQANGNRAQLNRQLLDGVDDTEGVGGGPAIVPSTDQLQEYQLVTSNYDIELGQAAGAVQLFTTKSGTNQLHGNVHEFNRVNYLSARNPFTEPNGPGHLVYNQFGGTLGGPVKRDKLFAFGYYEGYRYRSGGGILTTVPIPAFRAGDFSSLAATDPIFDPATGGAQGVGRTQFPNNQIPADRISPISAAMLALLPLPNVPGGGTNNNFTAPQINPINQDLGGIRIDYVLSDATRIFGRYTRQQGNQSTDVPAFGELIYPGTYGSGSGSSSLQVGKQNSAVANVTHVINPRLIVEGRFGWTYNLWQSNALDANQNTSQNFGIPNLNNACSSCGGLAGFQIGGPVGSFNFGNSTHTHQVDNYGKYNFVEIGTWTRGKNTIKFGNDLLLAWRDRRDTSSQGDFGCDNSGVCATNGFAQTITGSAAVSGSGLSTATFLLGDASNFGRVIYARGVPQAHNTDNALYVQDTWHATPKLTLTLGLRWDYIGYPTSPQQGGIANFNFTNTNTIISNFGNSSATADVNQNYGDFGPRVGFAWSALKNTVIRGGFAESFTNGFDGANFGAITNDWPNATRQTISQISDLYQPSLTLAGGPATFVSGFAILAAAGNPGQYPTPNSESFGVFAHNPTNSVYQWNASVQHQFGYDFSLTASYVGQANRHLFYRFDANAAPPGPGPINLRQPYNVYGFTTNAYNQGNQSNVGYNALEIQGQKRYSHGLTFTTAFTWSTSYDFGGHNAFDQFQTNLSRGPLDSNRKLVFVASHVWELPVGEGKQFLNKPGLVNEVVGGWQFSGIWTLESGYPFTPEIANNATLNSNCCTLIPDKTGNPNAVAHKGINSWFNPGAYTVPALYTEGLTPRNSLWGPGLFRADFSLQKVFKITERTKFQLQWEAYNAFNRANYSNPNYNIDQSTAGVISGVADIMRQMQLGGTLTF